MPTNGGQAEQDPVPPRVEERPADAVAATSRHRAILQTAMDGFWIADDEGRLVEVNDAYCRMSGYSAAELLQMRIHELEAIESSADTCEHIARIRVLGEDRFESRHRRKDGSQFDVEVNVQFQPDEGGQFVCFLRDVTTRRRLAADARLARTSVDFAADALFWITADARIVDCNLAASRMLGYSRDELVQLTVPDVDAHYDAARWPEHFAALRAHGALTFESEQIAKDGRRIPVEIVANYLLVDGEERNCAFVRDITERRRQAAATRDGTLRLDLALDAAGAGMWDWDVVQGTLRWSPGIYALFGLNPNTDTASFESWRRTVHPDDLEAAERRIGDALATRTSLHSDYRIVLPDGTVRWISAPGRGIYGEDGAPQRMIGICIDITERKASEAALLESEQTLRTIFSTMSEGVALNEIVFDATGEMCDYRVLTVNEAFYGLGEHERGNVIGRLATDVYGMPESMIRGFWHEHQARQTVQHTEFPAPKDPSRWYHVATSPFLNGRFVTTFTEITERRRAEEKRRADEARFRSWFELPIVGICLTSPTKGWIEVNDHLCHLLGYSRDELAARTWSDLTHPEDLAKDADQFDRVMRGESEGYSIEKRFVRKSGEVLDADLSVRCVRKPGGEVDYFVALIQDISARKRVEAEKAELETQLQHAQKLESVGRLAGGVAHDFNNMLGVILGNVELALQQTDPAHATHADLLEIRHAAQRSAALTRQLLAYARKQTVAPEVLDLNEATTHLTGMLRRLIGEDIRLHLAQEPSVWPVSMDPAQLASVLTNLCVNARQAIAGVGTIVISTANCVVDDRMTMAHADALPGDYVRLSVRDSGSGMDAATLAHIFEPFFTTKEVGEGTGLGLASVYGAVRQNGGFVTVASAVGEGSVFDVYLPRHRGAAPAAGNNAAPVHDHRGDETILVVEDEPGILLLAARILRSRGYTVIAAAGAAEAAQRAADHPGPIHLLLVDVVMPEMSGRDLVLRFEQLRPEARSLYMSGHTADVIARRGMLESGVSFLAKPFTSDALLAKVREVLDRE
ncbi:MAG: PAS domain S-box protein [Gemmatimonadota bacterium]|nr:PAS domain S-box protein [Gemmatimonadota bacterium]